MGSLLRTDTADSLRSRTLYLGLYQGVVWAHLLHSVKTGESARTLISTIAATRNRRPESTAGFSICAAKRMATKVDPQTKYTKPNAIPIQLAIPAGMISDLDGARLRTYLDGTGGATDVTIGNIVRRVETGRSTDGIVNTGTPRLALVGFRTIW